MSVPKPKCRIVLFCELVVLAVTVNPPGGMVGYGADPPPTPPLLGVGDGAGVEQMVAWGVTTTVPDGPEDERVSTELFVIQVLLVVKVPTSTDNC